MAKQIQFRQIIGTLNNPGSFKPLFDDKVKYACWQLERGAEGTVHFQFFIQFKDRVGLERAKSYFSDRCHIERPRSIIRSKNYCLKEDTRIEGPWEYGEFGRQGERTDLRSAMDFIKAGKSKRSLQEEYPEIVAKYPRFCNEYRASIMSDAATKLNLDSCDYDWQRELLKMCEEAPDRRTVHWYWSYAGETGKSKMQSILEDNMNALCLDLSQKKELYYIYDFQKIVCINIPRGIDDVSYIYPQLEQLKDGRMFSTKYEPVIKKFDPPHVIVFSNSPPDMGRMSEDRWHIVNVDFNLNT